MHNWVLFLDVISFVVSDFSFWDWEFNVRGFWLQVGPWLSSLKLRAY